MQQARQELGLSQKDLGQKINEKVSRVCLVINESHTQLNAGVSAVSPISAQPQVIGDYEAGRAIPNAQVLSKCERILKVKLRGKDIGKKLDGPGKK
jgi:putative transcription factor